MQQGRHVIILLQTLLAACDTILIFTELMNMTVVHSERVDYHHVTNESNPLIAHISISAAITAQVTTSNEFCETKITIKSL